MDCCEKSKSFCDSFDLVIIGSGSAAFAGAIKASELGKSVAIIEKGTVGGTCVNVGCVPSKTLIRAAESLHKAKKVPFDGIETTGATIHFKAIKAQKDELVLSLRNAKYLSVLEQNPNITLIEGNAEFENATEVRVGERIVKGEKILIATGSTPYIPDVPCLKESGFLVSDSAFELTELPESMIVLGGRYVALEIAQMFQRFGVKVTVLQRSNRLIPDQDPDVSEELTKHLRDEGLEVVTGTKLLGVEKNKVFEVRFEHGGEVKTISAEQLVLATGRRPNTASLSLEKVGIKIRKSGAIDTNEFGQTSVSNIYAAGDVIDDHPFVYTAAYGGNLSVQNAFEGNVRKRDFSMVPWVIFTDPQVAGVGINEQQAQELGIKVNVSKLTLDNVPRALAARDTRGFIKLLRKNGTDHLVGATIVAPEGSELLMELALAIKHKIPIPDLISTFHPYLTLGEGVKLAAQTFDKDVKTLSCCAA